MVKWKKEILTASCMLVLGILLLIYSLTLPTGVVEFSTASAGTYMAVWSVLLILTSAALVYLAYHNREKNTQRDEKAWHPMAIFTMVSLVLYIVLLDYVGFLLLTPVYVFISTAVYARQGNRFKDEEGNKKPKDKIVKQLLLYAAYALVISVAVYYLFVYGVDMVLPEFSLW